MLYSMTAFASATGTRDGLSWAWELRSVNGKGLDLRLRIPDWIDGLEAGLRARTGKALSRGNVSLSLRLQAEEDAGNLRLNEAQLARALTAMAEVEAQAMARGLSLAPANAADVLAIRGVTDIEAQTRETGPLAEALLTDFEALLVAFLEMRATEGQALQELLERHLDDIDRLTGQAAVAAEARRPRMEENFRTALQRILSNGDGVDEARVVQELATLAVKADVTEEIDRLRAHVTAARDLLAQGSPIGRRLDFLSQEFNREANTLCSKAQDSGLTAVGLELKAVIDQMREQVQNVE